MSESPIKTKPALGMVDRGYLITDVDNLMNAVDKSIRLEKMGIIRAVFLQGREEEARRWLDSYVSEVPHD